MSFALASAANATALGLSIAASYNSGAVRGWPGIDKARNEFNRIRSTANFVDNNLRPRSAAGKTMLYDITRKVLGKDTPNYAQQIGDCVSFGAKNATEYIQCSDMLLRGVRETWKAIFPPYYYGTSRCLIGGQHDYSDGSTGAWMAAAVMKYGGLFADLSGVPTYSGSVARTWGHDGPPSQFVTLGQKQLIKSAALITTWEGLCGALDNGYACPTASNVGYNMTASADGFFRQTTSWGHQMCFIGYGSKPEPYAIILNNWGDVHGKVMDFDDPTIQLPIGILRVRQSDAMKHVNAGETFAYSQFDGLLETEIPDALFSPV